MVSVQRIGVAKPVSIMVDTFGTGKLSDEEIAEINGGLNEYLIKMLYNK